MVRVKNFGVEAHPFSLEGLSFLAIFTACANLIQDPRLLFFQVLIGAVGMPLIAGLNVRTGIRVLLVSLPIPLLVFGFSIGWTALLKCVLFGIGIAEMAHGSRALSTSLRLFAVVFASLYLVSRLDMMELATRLTRLGTPQRLVHSLSIMYRAAILVVREVDQRRIAFRMRFARRISFREWIEYELTSPVQVILSLLGNADMMAFALESRGFDSARRPIALWRYSVSTRVLLSAMLASMSAVAVLLRQYL